MKLITLNKLIYLIFGFGFFLIFIVLGFYLYKFNGSLSNIHQVWGEFGSYFGGLLSPIINFFGFLTTLILLYNTKKELRSQMFVVSEGYFVAIERVIADSPSVLKFHGITEEDLEKIQISSKELSYLICIFTAGGITARSLNDKNESPFEKDDYFRKLLESPETRNAWSLIQNILSKSHYKKRIIATIDLINKNELEH